MASIVSDADDYVNRVVDVLNTVGIRAESDTRNEKINYKVREHSVAKVPVIFAIGMREVEENTVSMRRLGSKQSQVTYFCRFQRFLEIIFFRIFNPK